MHLHILKGDIDIAKMSEAQKPENQAQLAEAMVGYLEHLAPQIDDLVPELFKRFEELRKKAREGKDLHERYCETTAFLYLGFERFINYALAEEAISDAEAKRLLQEAWKVLNEVADDLAQVAKSIAPTKRFFEALVELTLQGRVYFADMTGKAPEDKIRVPGAVNLGWGPDANGSYYLLWGPTWEQVTKYLKNQEEGLTLSKNAFLDSLEQQGLLDKSDETQKDRRIIRKSIGDDKKRVLPVLKAAFDIDDIEEVEDGK
jgi:hypothetical protein